MLFNRGSYQIKCEIDISDSFKAGFYLSLTRVVLHSWKAQGKIIANQDKFVAVLNLKPKLLIPD